jgi:hypothetical protein
MLTKGGLLTQINISANPSHGQVALLILSILRRGYGHPSAIIVGLLHP